MPQTALWFALAIIVLFAIVASIQYPAVVKRRYFFYCLVLALAGTGFYVDFRDLWGDPHQEWQISILLGSSLIVLGWIFTNEMAIHSSRKQHTINLITQFVTSDQRVKDKETIRKHLPNRIALAPTLFNYVDENHELAQAIDRELNFFEFIAIGINSGDLEERMARRMMGGVLVFFVNQVWNYVDFWRSRDSETWEDVCALYERWRQSRAPSGR